MTNTNDKNVTHRVGRWLSAALDDPAVCDEMKADIIAWMEAGKPNVQPSEPLSSKLIGASTDTTRKIETLRRWSKISDSSALNLNYLGEIADEMERVHDVMVARGMQIDALEALRPHWAQGYTSDSVAAQAATTALAGLWKMLGVDNQTAACQRLRELLKGERK